MRFVALLAALAACSTHAVAAEGVPIRTITASQVVQEVAASGTVKGPVEVREDLDLSRLTAPKSAVEAPIIFHDVRFRGRLYGVPRHALRFNGGGVCEIDGEGQAWGMAVTFTREAAVGRMSFDDARLGAPFTCFGCRVCRSEFDGTQFAGEATFTGSRFGDPAGAVVCVRNPPQSCSAASFSEAVFTTTARFDRTIFREGAVFEGAEFRGTARFPRAEAAKALSFVGARITGSSEFRDCRFAAVYFGPRGGAVAQSYEPTQFGSQADFRGCRFSGPARFDNAVFLGEAVFSRTAFDDKVSFRGATASRSIDLRAAQLRQLKPQLVLDALAADSVRLDWSELGRAVREGAAELDLRPRRNDSNEPAGAEEQIAMFQALSRRLESQGAGRAAREVAFVAQEKQRSYGSARCDSGIGACLLGEAEWWLWTLPTRNSTDPTVLLAGLALLWIAVAAASLVAGRILVLPRVAGAEPIAPYAVVDRVPGAYHPAGLGRLREGLSLASRIVFKLGKPQARFAAAGAGGSGRPAAVVLWVAWLLSWVFLAAFAAVVAASFPGLGFLKAVL